MSYSLMVPLDVTCPSDFFVFVYSELRRLDPEIRSSATQQHPNFKKEIRDVLAENNGKEVADYLISLARKPIGNFQDYVGRLLAILCEIDQAFYSIHPRSLVVRGVGIGVASLPLWLSSLKNARRFSGNYTKYRNDILIPRGPLVRAARKADAASADSMADRYASLAVTPILFSQEDRPIRVTVKVVGAGRVGGIPSAKNIGSEVVGFVPVAENATDIESSQREAGGCRFVSFAPSLSIDPVKITLNALKKHSALDIAILPESVMPARLVPMLSEGVGKLASLAPRMLVCGSGDTEDKSALGMRWNEASVINSSGRVIWKQRKIWPAGFAENRAIEYGLIPAPGMLVAEDNASASELLIVDIDTLGRCMILICQDVLANDVSAQTIARFQPDWVLTPILDSGIATDRWINTRIYELSGLSHSRYLVASSLALAEKLGYSAAGCGLAMGPRASTDDDKAKQYIILTPDEGIAVVTWRDDNWSTSKLK